MVRTELREHIFKMLFQIEFNDSVDMPENLNYYFETLEDAKEKDKQYIQNGMRTFRQKLRSTRLLSLRNVSEEIIARRL